jgi:hypothetical protein
MIMKRSYILFIFLLVLLFGCKKKVDPNYYLTDEDKSWNIYHEGDTIKFLSNYNHKKYYRISKLEQGMREDIVEDDVYYEYIDLEFARTDTTASYLDPAIYMMFARHYNKSAPDFIILTQFTEYYQTQPFNILQACKIDTLNVNNIIFHGVLKMNGIDTLLNGALNRLYYVKEKGWLRFESNTGETWNRIN